VRRATAPEIRSTQPRRFVSQEIAHVRQTQPCRARGDPDRRSIQGPASARGVSPTANDLRSDPAFGRLQGASLGRAPNSVVFGGRTIGRDPDPNVRFQLMRDQARDRL
jgi:hypothetical protein